MPGWVRWMARAALAVAVAACSVAPVRPVPSAQRHAVDAFELDGRVAVRDGDRSGAVAVQWSHDGVRDHIDFVAPTGQVLARLRSDTDSAQLELPNGELHSADSLDGLAEQALGFRVPVSLMRDWVQAVPGAEARVLRRDAAGRPMLISEAGWLVEYLAYTGDDAMAPARRIEATWGELRVNLIIDAWTSR